MKVQLFLSCIADQFYPSLGWNIVEAIESAGHQVVYSETQTCCGMLALNAGHREMSKELAVKSLEELGSADLVVCSSAACCDALGRLYEPFFANTSRHNQFRQLQEKVVSFSFFYQEYLLGQASTRSMLSEIGIWLSCTHKGMGKHQSILAFLASLFGEGLIEVAPGSACCGASSGLHTEEMPVATAMGMAVLAEAEKNGVKVLLVEDEFCMLHLQGILGKKKMNMEVRSLTQTIAEWVR